MAPKAETPTRRGQPRAPKKPTLTPQEILERLQAKIAILSDDAVLTPAETAVMLGDLGKSTLQAWRRDGTGPDYVTFSRTRCGYRVGALRAYLREIEVGSTAEAQELRQRKAAGLQGSTTSASRTSRGES